MLAYMPGIIRKKTSTRMNTFRPATASFLPLDFHLPFQFKWNQNSTVTPQVNQERSKEELMLSKELNTGIALARIHTTIQNNETLKIHTPQSSCLDTGGTDIELRRPWLG